MAKIPQGEWNAIAARYSKGETLSSIARHYGCTPPAIHYILKRVDALRLEAEASAPVETTLQAPIGRPRRAQDAGSEQAVPPITARENAMPELQPVSLPRHRAGRDENRSDAGPRPAMNGHRPVAAAQKPRGAARGSALTAELDRELQAHAEAAIEAFRSSFAAALAENSPVNRERLRQTASDLMRAAARTTIVLDRLNAGGRRSHSEATD